MKGGKNGRKSQQMIFILSMFVKEDNKALGVNTVILQECESSVHGIFLFSSVLLSNSENQFVQKHRAAK